MLSIAVPPLGESIVEATVSRWRKKEGEAVAAGETLVELETDKVTVEVPALKAGVLARRARAEGDVVKVGEILGEVDERPASLAASPVTFAPPTPAASLGSPPPRQSAVVFPSIFGSAPSVGSPRADGPLDVAIAGSRGSFAEAATAGDSALTSAPPLRVSPAARRLGNDEGIDLATVAGTGRGGVISKPDVVEHIAQSRTAEEPTPVAAPSAPAAPPNMAPAAPSTTASTAPRESREKMSTRRQRIAEHLLESQHATAHLTTFNEIDLSAVESLRGRIKERIEKEQGVKLSMMPFFVKAACMALKQFPVVNARIDGGQIVYHHYVNMGIAVASDAGLVVPNIRDADAMGMIDIARAIGTVAKKARDGKLTIEDLTGGTFTITNGGVFGSLISTPIINFPQVGILGLHKTQERPVVVNGQIVVRPMMYVALSYDHRLIDGQQAVLFLVRVKELMEDPGLMAVD